MDRPTARTLRIGAWFVDPIASQISRGPETVRVEARAMRLLMCLAERSGEVVSTEDLMKEVWAGVVVTQDSVYQAVASLRRQLGDDPKNPAYIATVPRMGYRMLAEVSTAKASRPRLNSRFFFGTAAAACIALIATVLFNVRDAGNHHAAANARAAGVPRKSVAVLPILDLTTQEMNEEYFADGMTEELIVRLSRIPGLRVPPPTASFYFKGKRNTVAEVAKSLGVAYVLDGSIRKSGSTLRVAVRLVRADDGYVVWSETYDRPFGDKLQVQDEIASEVAKSLSASIT